MNDHFQLLQVLAAALSIIFFPLIFNGLAVAVASVFDRGKGRNSTLSSILPWVGVGNGPFAITRACFRDIVHAFDTVKDGYEKYSKHGKPFLLPSFTFRPEVVLPMSALKWLSKQPESVLSAHVVHEERIQVHHFVSSLDVPDHDFVELRDLTRTLDQLAPTMWNEAERSLIDLMGTNSQDWTEITLFRCAIGIIMRMNTRVFVGEQMAHNHDWIHAVANYCNRVGFWGNFAFQTMPRILRPILMPLLAIRANVYRRHAEKILIPVVRTRLDHRAEPKLNPDYIDWIIKYADKFKDWRRLDPTIITGRILIVNFAAFHTSILTLATALYSLLSSSKCHEYWMELRQEVREVHASCKGKWSKAAVADLVKLDSMLRESMRFGVLTIQSSRGLRRDVVAPGGITLPSGEHLPTGTRIAIPSSSIMLDEDVFLDAHVFKPFRFVAMRDDPLQKLDDQKEEHLRVINLKMTSPGPTHLGFGYGKTSCPGRFYVTQELKLILACLILNYDVEPLAEFPKGLQLGAFSGPNTTAKTRVRRVMAVPRRPTMWQQRAWTDAATL